MGYTVVGKRSLRGSVVVLIATAMLASLAGGKMVCGADQVGEGPQARVLDVTRLEPGKGAALVMVVDNCF